MATMTKFDQYTADVAAGVHANALTADTDTLKVYLTNAAPSTTDNAVKADLAEITNEHGYTAPVDVQNAASQTAGVITVTATDVTIAASGGTVGPFRYAVLYNDTPSDPADPLIGYWDYGSPVTLADGESIKIDFGASLLTVGA
ncbi:MAG TPA: hypothetical protein VG538_06270 [Vicinamibacterales bacterium]|jgi:hypothetical protein|nr:hypothetical protein [Vicinamibacterales bacterium]